MDKTEKVKVLRRVSRLGENDELKKLLDDPNINDIVNRRSGGKKQTALHVACIEGQDKVVEKLLLLPAISVDCVDARNWTPLCYVVDKSHIELVKKLIAKKANVNHRLNNGDTPLHIAAMKCNQEVCEVLLKNGADVQATNHNMWTPLHLATGECDTDIVSLLLKYKVNVDLQTVFGDTASNMAARNDSEDILKLLKANKANFDLANNNGECPVLSAAMGGHVHTLMFLLTNGADPMACAKGDMTIAHFAAKNGHTEIFHLLKEKLSNKTFKKLLKAPSGSLKGIWISTIGCGIILSGVLPLHLAAIEGHSSTVKALLQYGATKDEEDGNKHTPKELVEHYKEQFQVWDKDKIDNVLDVFDKEGENSPDGSPRRAPAADANLKYFDSDYYSTSSVTTEDVESNLGDLEDSLKNLEKGESSTKHVKRKRRALKKQIDRSGLMSEHEKETIYRKLETIEHTLQRLASSSSLVQRERRESETKGVM